MGSAASVPTDDQILESLQSIHNDDPERARRLVQQATELVANDPPDAPGRGTTVCVTGANGFLGSHLVKVLLAYGYTVRGTTRQQADSPKCAHLHQLPFANERLSVVTADLTQEGSFDQALEGCYAVFHTASPFQMGGDEEDMCTPAFHGTLSLLRSAANSSTVRKVIITSSMAAVAYTGGKLPPEHQFSGADWSDEDHLRERGKWGPLGKTIAERAAWKYVDDHDVSFSLATVCPGVLIGPLLQDRVNESSSMLISHINGSRQTIRNKVLRLVDVRDAAMAHLQVLQSPDSSARFLCVGHVVSFPELYQRLRELYPEADIPTQQEDGCAPMVVPVDDEPLRSLGWEPMGLNETLHDAVESLRERGYYPPGLRRPSQY